MYSMFSGCSSLVFLDLSNLNLNEVNNAYFIFSSCSKLRYINFKNAIFNWNVYKMFRSIKIWISDYFIIFSEKNDLNDYFEENSFIKCIYTNSLYTSEEYKCYMQDLEAINKIENICKFCGKDFNLKHYYDGSIIYCNNSQEGYIYNENEENISENEENNDENEEEEINDQIDIQDIVQKLLNKIDITSISDGNDFEIPLGDIMIIFTSTMNQKNNEKKSNINLDLGQCGNNLRQGYNISSNDSLYILEIIYQEPEMRIPIVEYEVYYPLNETGNLTKLDLTLCKDTKIEISIVVPINDTIDKHNASSDYYNDVCSKTTSSYGTDIILNDRRNDFINNNMTLCEENCDLIDYNKEEERAKCSCDVKLSITPINKIKFNKNAFLKNFIDIKNIMNFSILKCYKNVFIIKGLKKNYGFFIMCFILLFYFIDLIIFLINSFKVLKTVIINIISYLKSTEKIEIKESVTKQKKIEPQKSKKEQKRNKKKKNMFEDDDNKKNIGNNKIKSKDKNKKIKKNRNFSEQTTQNHMENSINKMNTLNLENNKNIKELIKQKDFELNSLDYAEAKKIDHRSYFQYYISLLKNNHPLIFSFFPYEDYNLKVIKIFLFFFSFSLDFTVNALFFKDDTMHKIHEDRGKYDFLFQIPQIIYSSFISRFIDGFIKSLALSQDIIVNMKKEKEKTKLDKKYFGKILKTLKKKFTAFYIISFIILVIFLYYISCFCGIYINTQIHLIKDSISSLFLSFVLPFIIYLIPGIFRIPALKGGKKSRKCLYKFSLFLENYL